MKALPVSHLPNNDQASSQINSGYMTGRAVFIPSRLGTPGPEDIFEEIWQVGIFDPAFRIGLTEFASR